MKRADEQACRWLQPGPCGEFEALGYFFCVQDIHDIATSGIFVWDGFPRDLHVHKEMGQYASEELTHTEGHEVSRRSPTSLHETLL